MLENDLRSLLIPSDNPEQPKLTYQQKKLLAQMLDLIKRDQIFQESYREYLKQ